jgi:transposase-like protein
VETEYPAHPVGGVDYPRTIAEFDKWFPDESACIEYIIKVRWAKGFHCPACGGSDAWRTKRGLFNCSLCQKQSSPTAGTVFEGTRKPLRTWFHAMWYITNQKHGVSALGLQRVLGLGSYQTAWTWLHKLRRAMVRPDRDKLSGEIEIDETYIGGKEKGVAGRKRMKKSVVAIAAEIRGRAIGRIRMSVIDDASSESLFPFIMEAVAEGSVLYTDSWKGYSGIDRKGYIHQPKNVAASGDPAHVSMPRVHRVASLLDRWWLGTHQGAISPKHLDYYLDEFTFRFNRRRSRARGLLFYRLVEQALNVDRVPYRQLVGGKLMVKKG